MNQKQKTIYYTLLVFISVIFFLSGLAKLLSKPAAVEEFSLVGLPMWFMYLVGLGEILGAICLWVKEVFQYAYQGLFLVLVGAFCATVLSYGFVAALYPLMVFAFLFIAVWLNKKGI